jgi:hypothetical protein
MTGNEQRRTGMYNPQVNQRQQNPLWTNDQGKRLSGRLTEMVVHINDELDEHRREALEQEMRGILDLCFYPGRHHLMIVQYQPDMVSSTALIDRVKQLAGPAQLVGPI